MSGKTPHVAAAEQYVRDVIAGRVPACKWTRLACERHLADKQKARGKDFPYRFDPAQAERVCRFLELLPHIKGKWARKDPKRPNAHKIRLEPFQCFITVSLYGWVKKRGGKRRFRKASVYLPRKNAKSTWAAGIGHWMAWKDGEPGAEVYSGATTEKQAWEVFGPARKMAVAEPQMASGLGITVNAQNLIKLEDGSKFEPIIGKPGDGASPHCSITDEYHEHATSEQYDTMLTGMGARDQPLALIISTSGDNLAGPCFDDWLTVKKVLERTLVDETHFGIIYTADDEDDWTGELALRKANPNYDVSVSAEFLQQQQRDAISNARKQGVFKTKHLNIWVQARGAYFNMQRWDENADPALHLEQFAGRRCFIGMDLASKVDIAALEMLFPLDDGTFVRFGRYYLPEETVEQPENQHYRAWRSDGWFNVTEGNIIDFSQILEDLKSFGSQFQLEGVAYDPHQATMLVTELQHEGIPCVEYRPVVLNFSEPMKEVDALLRAHRLKHNGDPVMKWMMSNVVARVDAKDNVYPRKEREQNKIDGPVALIMAKGLHGSSAGGAKSFWE